MPVLDVNDFTLARLLPMMLAARVLACALCTLPLLSTVSATCTIDEDSLIAGSSLKCVSARARASGWPLPVRLEVASGGLQESRLTAYYFKIVPRCLSSRGHTRRGEGQSKGRLSPTSASSRALCVTF